MASKYRNVTAVGQYDENSCWAACLEWWLKATNLGSINQEDVFGDYPLLRDTNGTILREGLVQLMDDPRWYVNHRHQTRFGSGFEPVRATRSCINSYDA